MLGQLLEVYRLRLPPAVWGAKKKSNCPKLHPNNTWTTVLTFRQQTLIIKKGESRSRTLCSPPTPRSADRLPITIIPPTPPRPPHTFLPDKMP